MLEYPFTNGKIEYIEDEKIRKEEIDTFLRFWHPESFDEENPVDILLGIKKVYWKKDGKFGEFWSQGLFNSVLSDTPTIDSISAVGEKGKPVNTLKSRPDFNAHYNIYTSNAEYPAGTGRTLIANVLRLPGVYFDIDIHDVEEKMVDKLLPKALGMIINASRIGALPAFNVINITGAGLALFLKYEEPVYASDSRKLGFHYALWEKICGVLEAMFSKDPAFTVNGKCIVEIDKNIKNINRNIRIPGTYHSCKRKIKRFSTLYSIDRSCQSLENLCTKMAVKEPETVQKVKKEDIKMNKVSVEGVEYGSICEIDKDKFTFHKKARDCAKRRLEQLYELMEMRDGGIDGSRRHNAVRLFWNYSRMLYEDETCVRDLIRFNNELSEPLSESFITFVFSAPYYIVGPDHFVEFLKLSKNEVDKLRVYEKQNKLKKAEERREYKPIAEANVKAQWEEGELSVKEICKRNHVCPDTVRRWVEENNWMSAKERMEIKKQKAKERKAAKRAEARALKRAADKLLKEAEKSSKKAEKAPKEKVVPILTDLDLIKKSKNKQSLSKYEESSQNEESLTFEESSKPEESSKSKESLESKESYGEYKESLCVLRSLYTPKESSNSPKGSETLKKSIPKKSTSTTYDGRGETKIGLLAAESLKNKHFTTKGANFKAWKLRYRQKMAQLGHSSDFVKKYFSYTCEDANAPPGSKDGAENRGVRTGMCQLTTRKQGGNNEKGEAYIGHGSNDTRTFRLRQERDNVR